MAVATECEGKEDPENDGVDEADEVEDERGDAIEGYWGDVRRCSSGNCGGYKDKRLTWSCLGGRGSLESS